MTNAIVNTLKWIHSHTPEEIADKMPAEFVGKDKALYVAALKNTLPMYSETGRMDPKGAQAVLDVFSQSSPDVKKANIDLSKTYTNKYVEAAPRRGDRDGSVRSSDTTMWIDRWRGRGHCLRPCICFIALRR